MRQRVDLNRAVEILRDAVQAGMLRHTTYGTSTYSVDTYLKTIVAVFIEGVREPLAKSRSNDSKNRHRKERK